MVKHSGLLVAAILGLAVAGAHGPYAFAQAPSSAKTIELPPDNTMATLKPGPGLDVVESECTACHSTDYIVRQPGGDAKHWEPDIRKMMTVYGVEISDADVRTIANYLGTEYSSPPIVEPGETVNLGTRKASPAPKRRSKGTGCN